MDLFHKTLDISKDNCFATGWGKDRFGRKGEYKTVLKQVRLGMLDFESCEEKLRETRLTRFFELDKSFTCAGGNKGKVSVQGAKSLWGVCSVFPRLGTRDTDRWHIKEGLCTTCQCPWCPISERCNHPKVI